jgi:fimbrial chaperone protein
LKLRPSIIPMREHRGNIFASFFSPHTGVRLIRNISVPRSLILCLLGALLWSLGDLGPAVAQSGFYVSPTRIDLDARARSGVITIANDTEDPMTFEVSLVSWTQDADAKDIYADSDDLVFFPRLVTVKPGDKRLIRVGLRGRAESIEEKAYRLMILEIPPAEVAERGVQVQVRVRFSVPLLVAPSSAIAAAEMDEADIFAGTVRLRVKNIGNQTIRIDRVRVYSGDNLDRQVTGWYLMPGLSRTYSVAIPRETCGKLSKLDVEVVSDKVTLKRRMDVSLAACGN